MTAHREVGKSQRFGLAGEHYVACELMRRGWIATLTHGNAWRTDVLAERQASGRLVSLQVKVRRTSGAWRLSGPQEAARENADEWFAFVDLKPPPEEKPWTYLVPRDHVSALTHAQHALDPNAGGRFVNVPDIKGYAEPDGWARFEQFVASEAPCWLPLWTQGYSSSFPESVVIREWKSSD